MDNIKLSDIAYNTIATAINKVNSISFQIEQLQEQREIAKLEAESIASTILDLSGVDIEKFKCKLSETSKELILVPVESIDALK